MEQNVSLRDYQLVDLAFYMQEERGGNLSDPGTGKTPPTCVYLWDLWKNHGDRTMFVMPKGLMEKNRKETLKFSGFDPDDVLIYDGTPKQRAKLVEESDAKVWLMGFRRFKDDWKILKDRHNDFNAVVVDEVHKGFGNHESRQTKALYGAMHFMKYFVPMTGTLIDGRLDTVYPCIHVIEPRYYGSFEAFKRIHAIEDFDGNVVSWKNHARLAKILSRHFIRRTFEATYGKNEVVMQVEEVDMAPQQRELYEELEDTAVLELEDRFMDTDGMQAVTVLRCRQIMAHPEHIKLPIAFDEEGNPTEWKVYNLIKGGEITGKDQRLVNHLEEHKDRGDPFIVFGTFKREVDRMVEVAESLGLKVGKIHGGVTLKQRNAVDQSFQDGEIDGIIGTADTCAEGYNWGFVNHVIFASMNYKDSSFLQARRRAERGKREKPLRVTVLEYANSIDQRIMEIVERKSYHSNKVDETNERVKFSDKRVKPKPKKPREPTPTGRPLTMGDL